MSMTDALARGERNEGRIAERGLHMHIFGM